MDQCATIRRKLSIIWLLFLAHNTKQMPFILCGLTIKWPQNHFLSHFAPDKLLCQATAAWKTSGDTFPAVSRQEKSCFFCLLNLIVFAFDWHYHWWKTELFHMPGASCWPIIANIVLESKVKCQLPTQCLSLKLMFPFGNATGSFPILLHYSLLLPASFLATPQLWCFAFPLGGWSKASVCFLGILVCLLAKVFNNDGLLH